MKWSLLSRQECLAQMLSALDYAYCALDNSVDSALIGEAIQKGADLMDELKSHKFDTSSYIETPISLERPADTHRRELIERQKTLLDLLRRASGGLSDMSLCAEAVYGKNSRYVKSMDALVADIDSELRKDVQNEKTSNA